MFLTTLLQGWLEHTDFHEQTLLLDARAHTHALWWRMEGVGCKLCGFRNQKCIGSDFSLFYRKHGVDFFQGLFSVMHLIQVVWILTQHSPNLLIAVTAAMQMKHRAIYLLLSSSGQLLQKNLKSQLSFLVYSPSRKRRGTPHHQEMFCRLSWDERELRCGGLFHQML